MVSMREREQLAKDLPILNLPRSLSLLELPDRDLFNNIFEIMVSNGEVEEGPRMIFPVQMQGWVVERFKNGDQSTEETLERMSHQTVLTVTNRWTKEGGIYNPNRLKRPRDVIRPDTYRAEIEAFRIKCATESLCNPLERTPETEGIGRITDGDSYSFANLTKFAPIHEMIAGPHNPFDKTEETFRSQAGIMQEIASKANKIDPSSQFVMWGENQGPDSGASILHQHSQVMINNGTMHFAEAERWHEASVKYRSETGRDFTTDWFILHEAIGLGLRIPERDEDIYVVTPLTPKKDFGVVVLGSRNGDPLYLSDKLIKVCWEIEKYMTDTLGIEQFNRALYMPPLARDDGYWSDFRPMWTFVRRTRGDVAIMETAGTPVMSVDPKSFAPQLFGHLLKKLA